MKLAYKKPGGKRRSRYGRDGKFVRSIPPVSKVADLIEVLKQLPPELPISNDEGIKPVWFNVGLDDEHLSFEENDGTFDEYD